MANRWGKNRNSDRLYFLGLQNHCRRSLQQLNEKMLFGRKDQPSQHMKKQRDITLLTKVHIVEAVIFSIVGCDSQMYGCESQTIKQVEQQRIDPFELWYWRRLLRIPWTTRRSNQSILKEINPEYSLEGVMLKLKLQYSGHLMRRADLLKRP